MATVNVVTVTVVLEDQNDCPYCLREELQDRVERVLEHSDRWGMFTSVKEDVEEPGHGS